MAEPRIQYCRTRDGVSIAFWSIGQIDPIIDAGHPPTHCVMADHVWWFIAPFISGEAPVASQGRGSIHTILFTDMEWNTDGGDDAQAAATAGTGEDIGTERTRINAARVQVWVGTAGRACT